MGHRFNPNKVHKLDNPKRRELLPPEETLAALHIQDGDNVADIGVGIGYFAIPAARLTSGTVYGIDVEPQMLEMLKEKCEAAGISNLRMVQSEAEQINLPDSSVEKVICAFMLHELNDLRQGLLEMKRILRPGGKVLILDWEKKETQSGPPVEERLAAEFLQSELEKTGFRPQLSRPHDSFYLILAELV
ncbi:class I SAM-dependent methyltransferase [Effusibacillus dendaii]|uniref:Methyltransferase type 11 n=1 Tax=Effusibacillus dendaii TaxID=2743772 RepID=A0A7I8DCH0_9BACL|nr:methyltransferase domain-containing protein [Effusibacillus dendaii]BCJ86526.1 methyltransferase type 11 [Effusibacillus dendaii]